MAILDTVKEVQEKMDTTHKMLAEYTRNKTSSVELLARANDLRYAAQVSFHIAWYEIGLRSMTGQFPLCLLTSFSSREADVRD